jgi:hypothetical protein
MNSLASCLDAKLLSVTLGLHHRSLQTSQLPALAFANDVDLSLRLISNSMFG